MRVYFIRKCILFYCVEELFGGNNFLTRVSVKNSESPLSGEAHFLLGYSYCTLQIMCMATANDPGPLLPFDHLFFAREYKANKAKVIKS